MWIGMGRKYKYISMRGKKLYNIGEDPALAINVDPLVRMCIDDFSEYVFNTWATLTRKILL